VSQGFGNGYSPIGFSQDGTLYYVQGGDWLARSKLVWIDRDGKEGESLLEEGAYGATMDERRGMGVIR